jgi:hypothetical protein
MTELKAILGRPHSSKELRKDAALPLFLRPGPYARDLIKMWYNNVISDDYSRRQLKHTSDKLVAIAGIATAIQQVYPMRYFAGM